MRCAEALERMMTAGPAELAGRVDSPLSRHIRQCERCRPLAAALTSELRQIEEAMESFGAAGSADAGAGADRPGKVPARRGGGGGRRGRAGRRWGDAVRKGGWVPLAAAAAVAGLLLWGEPEPEWPRPVESERLEPRVAIRPPADREAVVMATADPKITIVWLYQEEGT